MNSIQRNATESPLSESRSAKRKGLLLLNVGTPERPETAEVRSYLREFLMDPYVIDIPWLWRWLLVHGLVLPKRPALSAEAYRKIWTDRGSPLLFHLEDLVRLVQEELSRGSTTPQVLVRGGMRYGEPSLRRALEFFKQDGRQDGKNAPVEEVIIFPLYPQYSLAATESSIQKCRQIAEEIGLSAPLRMVSPFYGHPSFIHAYCEVIRSSLGDFKYDHLLMSFHGLPERQVKKTDPTGQNCVSKEDCCHRMTDSNQNCYRAQSYETARLIAAELGLTKDQYTVCFQSRLGRTPWIKPFTDELYPVLPSRGIKRLAVVCPSFVADCLETLEEVDIRGRKQFHEAGGEEFKMVPSLNSSKAWVSAVSQLSF